MVVSSSLTIRLIPVCAQCNVALRFRLDRGCAVFILHFLGTFGGRPLSSVIRVPVCLRSLFGLPRPTTPIHTSRVYLAMPDDSAWRRFLNRVSPAPRFARSGQRTFFLLAPWRRPRDSRIFWTIARAASSCTSRTRRVRALLAFVRRF